MLAEFRLYHTQVLYWKDFLLVAKYQPRSKRERGKEEKIPLLLV